MSVATRKGDRGRTDLYLGRRVSKDHPRVEVFGSLDELGAFLGFVRSLLKNKGMIRNPHILAYLNRLSDLLFVLSRYYEPVSRKLAYEQAPSRRAR